jgi:hypothetical protein
LTDVLGKGSVSIFRIRQPKEGASRTQSPYGLHGKENLLALTRMEQFVEQSLPSIDFTFLIMSGTSTQDKITTQRAVINPLKGWDSSNFWEQH